MRLGGGGGREGEGVVGVTSVRISIFFRFIFVRSPFRERVTCKVVTLYSYFCPPIIRRDENGFHTLVWGIMGKHPVGLEKGFLTYVVAELGWRRSSLSGEYQLSLLINCFS